MGRSGDGKRNILWEWPKSLEPKIAYKVIFERRINFVRTMFTSFCGGSSSTGQQMFLLTG